MAIQGGAGKGQMTDVAYRAKQSELAAKNQETAQVEQQKQQFQQGVQGGLDRIQAQSQQAAAIDAQNQQFRDTQSLAAAKSDLEYDPDSRTYKPTLMSQGKQQAEIEAIQAKTLSSASQQEFDQLNKMAQVKLEAQRESRLTEQMYLGFQTETDKLKQKYDGALVSLMEGANTGKVGALDFLSDEAKSNPEVKTILDGVRQGSPEATQRAFAYLKNKISFLSVRSSTITGQWPDLDPNSQVGIAWTEHHRQFDGQVRQMASAYMQAGREHPLQGMSTREQKRFITGEAARTFLPIFSMKVARMQNGAGTGSASPGAAGAQAGQGGSKFRGPGPAVPGAAGAGAPGLGGTTGTGTFNQDPTQGGAIDPASDGWWNQQR